MMVGLINSMPLEIYYVNWLCFKGAHSLGASLTNLTNYRQQKVLCWKDSHFKYAAKCGGGDGDATKLQTGETLR